MKIALISLFSLFLIGCGKFIFNPKFDPSSGCLLQKIELKDEKFSGHAGYVGYCLDDSILARYEAPTPDGGSVWVQVVRYKDKRFVVSYRSEDGSWINWSEKSGLTFDMPTDFSPENIENSVKK